ncbi:Molybdenum cofactor sulfurase, partial [Operophtera brumata]
MLTGQESIINDSHHSSLDSRIGLKEIAIFPVKSCGAFKIKSGWMIGPKGFEFDREWMIVNDNRVCLTQKQNTRMCMIQPTQTSLSTSKTSSLCQSKICADSVKGHDCGDSVADWISEALEVSFLRLIRQASTDGRSRKKNDEVKQKMLSLSNQAQYLLINKATVRWLCGKIRDPLFTDAIDDLVDRFRANLIIDMETELAERDWNKVVIGKHEFKMVCIDQRTGEKTVEPLRTIAEQFAGKLRFGIYLSYVGTIDGSKDRSLKTNTSIRPKVSSDDEIS